MQAVQILIGGDVYPGGRNQVLFERGDAAGLFNDLLPEFTGADLAVANLESPLVDRPTPISKIGPVLEASSACTKGLVRASLRCLGLANNHIRDHGGAGVESTLRACAQAGIATFGAGRNLAEAGQLLVVQVGGLRLGLLGLADNEWSIATETSPGANPLDIIRCVRTLQQRRAEYDYLIVLLHGGVEHYPYPTPRLQETCRFLVEQGARLVLCQHSHCAGSFETYRNGYIIYGQGNLLFDHPGHKPFWYEGFLVRLRLQADLTATWEPVPYVQSLEQPGARRMTPERERAFLTALQQRSKEIIQNGFVPEEWARWCQKNRIYTMNSLLGYGRLLQRLNRKGAAVKYLGGNERLRGWKSLLSCEAHREVVLTVLEQHFEQP